jgi:carbamoyltransferase
MKKILQSWIEESQVPVLLIPIPMFHHVEGTASAKSYQARFSELSKLCTIHDPLPDLLKYDPLTRRSFRFGKDVHPTIKGHEALAASILPVIQKML